MTRSSNTMMFRIVSVSGCAARPKSTRHLLTTALELM